MSQIIDSLERAQLRKIPRFEPGDRVRVHFQVVEGNRRRTQVFEGVVIRRQGSGARETFTVRKLSFGVGVERTFPVHSPKIEKIEVAARGDVRRAKLYYLRGRVGRAARVRERRFDPRAAADALAEQEALDAEALAMAEQEAAPVITDEGTEAPVEELEQLDAEAEAPADEAPAEAEPEPAAEPDAEAEQADDVPADDSK